MSEAVVKGYGIFDGGGVLGAALAGALKAAEEDIEFVGFGGTSAGSIVATLAAVGYSGREIESILVETDFTEMLAENGAPVRRFKTECARIMNGLARGGVFDAFKAVWRLRQLAAVIKDGFGIDDGRALQNFILTKIRDKWPDPFKDAADVTFADLARLESRDNDRTKPRCFPLKIVASDVSKRKPVIFSKDDTGYSASVLDAVRASTCYPFIFQPFDRNNQVWLVDGGLASNLPAFLFHKEQTRTKFPVFAFDLVSQGTTHPSDYNLPRFLRDMISTALDAGDDLLRQVLRDVNHVPILIPDEERFDVLNFEIDRGGRKALFSSGYEQTRNCLQELKFLKLAREAESMRQGLSGLVPERVMEAVLQKQLQARYGDPKLFETILAALARDVESLTKARKVRAHIMLQTGRVVAGRPTRIVVYSYGMLKPGGDQPSEDSTLELAASAGCTGNAWSLRRPVVADLEEAARKPSDWDMTVDQHSRVPADRKAMLSVPVWGYPDAERVDREEPIGTLSIDSSTPLSDTQWMDVSGNLQSDVLKRLLLWENVIRRLLP